MGWLRGLDGVARAVAVMALALPCGCGAGISLVLKDPIVSKCQDVGLRGCDSIADGVIDYVAGEKGEALPKIKKGVAANEPDQLREFADKIRLLKSIPGAAQYAGPLLEVADLLASATPGATPAREGPARDASGPARPTSAGAAGLPPVGLAGTVVPLAASSAVTCKLLSDEAFAFDPGATSCTSLGRGPLVVTDVQTTGPCPDALLIGAGPAGSPTWFLLASPMTTLSVHGAAYPVRTGDTFFAAQVAPVGSDGHRDARCAITWAATR